MSEQDALNIIKLVWPIILIQVGLQVYALVDLIRRKKTKNLSVAIWALIIVFGELLGPIVYLVIGRSEE